MQLDPCFDALLADRRIHLRRPRPPITLQDVRDGGNRFMSSAVGPDVACVEPVAFVGVDGRHVPGRAYRAARDGAQRAIVFFHGGGFVFGNLDTHDAICRQLAASSGATVLAVDYRLSPEHPFPAGLEDCTAALRHVAREPARFGVLPGALAIVGDSAGAHLAIGAIIAAGAASVDVAAGTAEANARGTAPERVPLAHAALLYPVVDPRCDSASMHELERGYMLTREGMQWFWDCYLGEGFDAATLADPRVHPLVAASDADLARFPPTTIVTAECDPLRSEGGEFARRLSSVGVHVDHECRAGMIHGFAGMPQITPAATHVVSRLGALLGRALAAHPPVTG